MTPKPPQNRGQTTLPKLFRGDWPDTVAAWADAYLRLEVTTSERSRKEQQRDLQSFLDFFVETAAGGERTHWTPRLSRTFVDSLRAALAGDRRRWSDRTINRMVAHLKTFAKWIHKHRPFPLGDPMAKLRGGSGLVFCIRCIYR